MALRAEERAALLEQARELYGTRRYAALVQLLSAQAAEELIEEPELGFLLADARHRVGELADALALLLRLGPVCARRGNDRLFRDRLNLEGVVLFKLGHPAEATQAWNRLLGASSRVGDSTFVARANNNLGVLHTLGGDREAALLSYQRAIAAYQKLGYLRGLAQAHHNLALIFRELGFWAESDRHFVQALEYARIDASTDEIARVNTERALLLCYRGDRRLAAATARRALAMWERLEDPIGASDATRILGIIGLAGRELVEAREHAEQALALARRAHAELQEAETLELRAAIALARGEAGEAAADRQLAERLFARMGAEVFGARSRERLDELLSQG